MISMMIAAIVAAPTESIAHLGPLATGEPVRAVRRLFGRGTLDSRCAPHTTTFDACAHTLRYDDGRNVLSIEVDADGDVSTIRVDLSTSDRKAARATVPSGAFATWTWAGAHIDRLPAKPIAGWNGPIVAPHRDCFAEFKQPTSSRGTDLVATFRCARGTARVDQFFLGAVDR